MKNTTIAFIGGGNMAASIIGGLIAAGSDATNIRVSDPLTDTHAKLKGLGDVFCTTEPASAIDGADVVVLAVKPQVMEAALAPIAASIAAQKMLTISIAAGIPLSALQRWLADDCPIVRCMPNTPALIGQGAAALFASDAVNTTQRDIAERILAAAGTALWVETEAQLDAVTALSGSGPAYYFYMMEVMIEIGQELGLSEAQAKALTLQTATGAAAMASRDGVDVGELRRQVTSPGGTTQAALESLQSDQYSAVMRRALTAARDRSLSLAKEWAVD